MPQWMQRRPRKMPQWKHRRPRKMPQWMLKLSYLRQVWRLSSTSSAAAAVVAAGAGRPRPLARKPVWQEMMCRMSKESRKFVVKPFVLA